MHKPRPEHREYGAYNRAELGVASGRTIQRQEVSQQVSEEWVSE